MQIVAVSISVGFSEIVQEGLCALFGAETRCGLSIGSKDEYIVLSAWSEVPLVMQVPLHLCQRQSCRHLAGDHPSDDAAGLPAQGAVEHMFQRFGELTDR